MHNNNNNKWPRRHPPISKPQFKNNVNLLLVIVTKVIFILRIVYLKILQKTEIQKTTYTTTVY